MSVISARLAHWKTSASGVAISGAMLYVMSSLGCTLPADWMTWTVTVAPAVLGILAKDH